MKNKLCNLFLLIIISICSLQAVANPPPAYEGRRIFVSYCQLCHGVGGKGDGPLSINMKITPADLTTTVRSRSDTILTKIISGEGRQTITGRDRHNILNDAMPKWKDVFTSKQIKALIAYLRFLTNSKYELMGDPEIGMTLYQKYCSVCHGEEGEGDGILTEIMGISPLDHSNPNEINRLDNNQIIQSILNGKGEYMPAWKGNSQITCFASSEKSRAAQDPNTANDQKRFIVLDLQGQYQKTLSEDWPRYE